MENTVNVKSLNNVRLSLNLTFYEARELSEILEKNLGIKIMRIQE